MVGEIVNRPETSSRRMHTRVLLIDDDLMFAPSRGWYAVEIEADPVVALARIRADERFDLIVCRLKTTSSADKLLVELRAHFAGHDYCPTIVVASRSGELSEVDATTGVAVPINPVLATELRTFADESRP
jgi:hypothetical protein